MGTLNAQVLGTRTSNLLTITNNLIPGIFVIKKREEKPTF